MSKFDELKKLAEAATPGIWTAEPPAEDYERDGGEQYHWSVRAPYSNPPMISYQLCRLSSLNNNEEEDAKFIAAANPAAVLELLAIQAQLVEALKLMPFILETQGNEHERDIVAAALAAVGVTP